MDSDIVFFAFRYSVSYGNDLPRLAKYVVDNWATIKKHERAIIVKEVAENLPRDGEDTNEHFPLDGIEEIKKREDYNKWREVISLDIKEESDKKKFPYDSNIVYWSFKYCLGRMTYVTSMMSEYLVKNWDKIDKDFQEQIIDDILLASKRKGGLGWSCDKESWMNVVDSSKIKGGHIVQRAFCPKCFPNGSTDSGFERTVAYLWDGTKSWCTNKCGIGEFKCSGRDCGEKITEEQYEANGMCASCVQDVLSDHCVFD